MKGGLGGEAPQKKKVLKEHAEVYKFRKIFEGGGTTRDFLKTRFRRGISEDIFQKNGLEGGHG